MKRIISEILAAVLILGTLMLTSCKSRINPNLDTEAKITLSLVGDAFCADAIDLICSEFTDKYPNCVISYTGIEDYSPEQSAAQADLFLSDAITGENELTQYALDLYNTGTDKTELSEANDAIITAYENNGSLYCAPLACNISGMLVNTTLLDGLGIEKLDNRKDFLAACQTIKTVGITPIQGSNADIGTLLIYPYIANLIDASKKHSIIEEAGDGVAATLSDALSFYDELVEAGYVSYAANKTMGESFADRITVFMEGSVAFLPCVLDEWLTVRNNVDSNGGEMIDYRFICAPTGENGGYGLLVPWKGIAVNKYSDNIDWCVELVNFMFEKENLNNFANKLQMIPNTNKAGKSAAGIFNLPDNHVTDISKVSFSYDFYSDVNSIVKMITAETLAEVHPTTDDYVKRLQELLAEHGTQTNTGGNDTQAQPNKQIISARG